MNIGCYDKLLTFLNYDVEKLIIDNILAKGEELGVTFPNSLVRFYYYFGNCNEVLNGYYKFFKLEDIKIWHEGIVFGTNDENGTLGIKLKDLNDTKDPTVYYTCEDTDDWFSELNYRGSEAFFFNIACMNIMQAMAVVNISKKYFFSKILDKKKVFSFYDDKNLKKGYYMSACHNEDFSVLGCYVDDVLYVAANDDDTLNDFEKKTKWELDWL